MIDEGKGKVYGREVRVGKGGQPVGARQVRDSAGCDAGREDVAVLLVAVDALLGVDRAQVALDDVLDQVEEAHIADFTEEPLGLQLRLPGRGEIQANISTHVRRCWSPPDRGIGWQAGESSVGGFHSRQDLVGVLLLLWRGQLRQRGFQQDLVLAYGLSEVALAVDAVALRSRAYGNGHLVVVMALAVAVDALVAVASASAALGPLSVALRVGQRLLVSYKQAYEYVQPQTQVQAAATPYTAKAAHAGEAGSLTLDFMDRHR